MGYDPILRADNIVVRSLGQSTNNFWRQLSTYDVALFHWKTNEWILESRQGFCNSNMLYSLNLFTYVYCGKTTFRPNMLNSFHVCCNQLRRLYQAIDEHWNIFTSDVDVRVMKNYSMLSRKFTKYYSSKCVTMLQR